MKQADDTRTLDLLAAKGRPPKFGRAMTAAERQAKVRQARQVREDALRDNLRYIVTEVQLLRRLVAAPGADLDQVQERLKGVKDAAMGTQALLGHL